MSLLTARGVNVVYEPSRGQRIWAVRDVDLDVAAGEFAGIVGESGCGKTTLGYALSRMLRPPARLASGVIRFDGTDLAGLNREQLRHQRHGGVALVLQSGMNALNPVRSVEQHFRDVLRAHEKIAVAAARDRGTELLDSVSLEPAVLSRFPHELSGGMRQRVAIALALALEPRMIVFDEPTTALDVIVQQAVLQTIKTLQRTKGFTAILISHDLGVVLEATQRVMVMYAGRIVEDAPTSSFPGGAGGRPPAGQQSSLAGGEHHPYTEALLACYADPRADVVELGGIPGTPPDLSVQEQGCAFTPRCPLAVTICAEQDPPLAPLAQGMAACHVRTRPAPAEVRTGNAD